MNIPIQPCVSTAHPPTATSAKEMHLFYLQRLKNLVTELVCHCLGGQCPPGLDRDGAHHLGVREAPKPSSVRVPHELDGMVPVPGPADRPPPDPFGKHTVTVGCPHDELPIPPWRPHGERLDEPGNNSDTQTRPHPKIW